MEEIGGHELEQSHEDPRTIFADSLRDFFMLAISQQKVIDGDERRTKPAGSLYKTDGGFLKIHLQAPAADKVFSSLRSSGNLDIINVNRPPLWVLIPLGNYVDEGMELEDVVLAADSLMVHVAAEGELPIQFLVRDDYVGPAVPLYESVEDLQAYSPPDEAEQLVVAQGWVGSLSQYDLRTITASRVDAA